MRPLTIGQLTCCPPVALAPMAGVTDAAFRPICRQMGAGLTYTEMVSAEALTRGNARSWEMAAIAGGERPVGLQLFGHDPEVMRRAVAAVVGSEHPPDLIDLNMGCPVRKVVSSGDGAALMRDPHLAARLVEAACLAAGVVPVTVKIRAGWDASSVNAPAMARGLEAAGASAITVHGRTRADMYEGEADWDVIRMVREAVSVPVIGNGDVDSGAAALAMFRATGVHGVMVGRAALGNPWVFSCIRAALSGTAFSPPSHQEVAGVMIRHLDHLIEIRGPERGIREMRKHAGWYVRGMLGARRFRRLATSISSRDDLVGLVSDMLNS